MIGLAHSPRIIFFIEIGGLCFLYTVLDSFQGLLVGGFYILFVQASTIMYIPNLVLIIRGKCKG